MILYEYPFNERIRTYLRLEHLLQRLGALMSRDSALDHHFALTTLFEVMDVVNRADLKADVLKDLDRHKTQMAALRGNPAIAEDALALFLGRIDSAFTRLNQQHGKPAHELADNEWLMAIRSRAVIPGGTCAFDLPAYHAWQQQPAESRRADITRWAASLQPLTDALALLLQMLRESGLPQMVMALGGQFQQMLPQGRPFQLLRLRIDPALGLIPEISGNRLLVSVRLMRQDGEGRLHPDTQDAPLELALCA